MPSESQDNIIYRLKQLADESRTATLEPGEVYILLAMRDDLEHNTSGLDKLRAELATEKERHCETLAAEARLLTELAELRARVKEVPIGFVSNYAIEELNAGRWPITQIITCKDNIDGMAGHVAIFAGPQPAPAHDVVRDAERYRYIRDNAKDGAVKTLLPLYRAHYFVSLEPISECPTFDAAIDAAILAASKGEKP